MHVLAPIFKIRVRKPSIADVLTWARVNQTLTQPWIGMILGSYDPEHSCGHVVCWIELWNNGETDDIPQFLGTYRTMTLTHNVIYSGHHVTWRRGARSHPLSWRRYGVRLSDFDPRHQDFKDTPELNRKRKMWWDRTERRFVAYLQGNVTNGVASTMIQSGSFNFTQDSLSQLFDKKAGSHGGHIVARYIDDDMLCNALNDMLLDNRVRVVIDVGAKYMQTPKLLTAAGFRGTYIPVRLRGREGDMDETYRLENEHRYSEKQAAWARKGLICEDIRYSRIEDCTFRWDKGDPSVVLLMNSCHYYLGGWTLPYNAHVCGIQFPELEAFYTLFNREGWFKIFTKDQIKWVNMKVNRNTSTYSHPLVRVKAAPVTITAFEGHCPYQYCHWYIQHGRSPFMHVAGDNDYRPVNYTLHLCLVGLKDADVCPLSNDMENELRSHQVSRTDSKRCEWNFSTFSWDREEMETTVSRPPSLLLHVPLVVLSLLITYIGFAQSSVSYRVLAVVSEIIMAIFTPRRQLRTKRWVSVAKLTSWTCVSSSYVRLAQYMLTLVILHIIMHSVECGLFVVLLPLATIVHAWRTRDQLWHKKKDFSLVCASEF